MAKTSDREKAWEQVQIKAFTAWVNSYLVKRDHKIEDLQTDLCDGVYLCEFLEVVTSSNLKYSKTPQTRHHKFQNVTTALEFIQKDLKVRLVSIGSEDFVDGRIKLILGLLWSLFRKLRLETFGGSGGDRAQEEGLLKWVREMTEGYKGVDITTFKHSFHDGLALSALVHRFDDKLVDYDSIDPHDREANLNRVFDLAEEHLGIPKLLDAQDLMNQNPDERSVVLYLSLYFHAFVSNEEKMKTLSQVRQVEDELSTLRTKVEENEESIANLERERERLLGELDSMGGDLKKSRERISELEDKNRSLQGELDELKKTLEHEREQNSEKVKFLEEKIKILSQLLEDNDKDKSDADAQLKKSLEELEREKKAREALEGKTEGLEGDLSAKDKELDDEKKRRARMQHEIEDLKKKVAKELARRRAKAQALAELQKELQALKKKAIVEGKARRGLDVLKKNLEEHLEDMYQWRDLHQLELEGERLEFNLEEVLSEISQKSFEEQLDILNDKLQAENKNLTRIIKLKDVQAELKESVEKEGWLYMKASKKQKDWKKQWFVLRGSNLLYYKDEKADKALGDIPLAECQMIALKAEKVEDPNSPIKKFFITRVAVDEKSVYLGFTSLKEKSSWMLPLKSKMQHHAYLRAVDKHDARPDTRILALFAAKDVKTCYLDNNPVPLEGVEAVTGILSLHDGLDTVHMINAHLQDADLKPLVEALPKWKLKVLNLSHNKLTSAGATEIAKALSAVANENLVELHLDSNEIDDAGAAAIAAALPNLKKLKKLSLGGNRFGDKGASSLVAALKDSAVPVLALEGNNISDAGAEAIAKMLGSTSTVTTVHLASNEIGDAGCEALGKALADNVTVEELDLSLNQVGNKGALALQKLLKKNKSIQTINLSQNKNITCGEEIKEFANTEGFVFPSLVLQRVL